MHMIGPQSTSLLEQESVLLMKLMFTSTLFGPITQARIGKSA